jgi:threonine dehydratase
LHAHHFDVHPLSEAAEKRIRRYVVETPVERSPALSELTGAQIYVKLENLQHTGSFKVRGALNKLLSLGEEERVAGVVAASTGNHGAAVAYGLAALAIPGIIFVPETASEAKVANIRRLGADLRFHGIDGGDTEIFARAYAGTHGMTYISPYNDWDVVAGQGTIGIEIARQVPSVNAIVASLGGGGMIGGVAGYIKALRPNVRIVAASPRNSKAMIESVKAGRIVETEHLPTLSDGTAGGVEPGAITLELCRTLVDEYIDVTEAEIKHAMRLFIETHHMLIEGAAGVAVAALLQAKERFAAKTVAVIICGANIGASRLKEAL